MKGYQVSFNKNAKNALHKAVNATNNQANIQHSKLMKLDDTMLM